MKMGTVRITLFFSWLAMFALYMLAFLTLPFINGKIDWADAQDAAWKTTYIFLPIVTAFATFYLSLDFSAKDENTERVHHRQATVAFCISIMFHLLAIVWFLATVCLATYSFSNEQGSSFNERVSTFHKILVMFSSLAVLPVGWVLKRSDMKSLASMGGTKPQSSPGKRSNRKSSLPPKSDGIPQPMSKRTPPAP